MLEKRVRYPHLFTECTVFSSLKVTTESGSLCLFTDAWHLMV